MFGDVDAVREKYKGEVLEKGSVRSEVLVVP
jgi:hypothetical protein